nr:hypothetical protein [Pseudotabrizicola algicola]
MEKTEKTQAGKAPLRAAALREARLKAALKANMARRKAQAKLRGGEKISSQTDSGTGSDPASQT